jgi:divalent metal cation (Fe/Co/Zn/Cd) transporter
MLAYLTLLWNAAEGFVGVAAGAAAGSVSLTAFGIDSLIEFTSGGALLWRMAVDPDTERRERNEKLALQVVGLCFVLLAVYIVCTSASKLLLRKAPERSLAGIVVASASLIAMPLLARAKKKVACQLNSSAVRADAKQSEFCAWLSGIVLAGLVLNATVGLWWADATAGLIMVPLIVREGVEALRGTKCTDCLP